MTYNSLNVDKIKGCFWGLALGDALGQPVEFASIEKIRDIYGDKGVQTLEKKAIWTDDTEMTIALTRALLRLGTVEYFIDLNENEIGEAYAKEFINWLDNPGYAPGITTTEAVSFLKIHGAESWRKSGKNDSKGCGSVMRAAPLGIWFANALKPELPLGAGSYHKALFNVSKIQSEITHGHKAATAAALAGSYAVALAINGIPPDGMIHPIEQYCNSIHLDFKNAMERLKISLNNRENGTFKTDSEGLSYIGQGWVGDEAFAMALYSTIQYPNDFKTCLRVSVNHSGDSDSVACIAGSILGALHGIATIPEDWLNWLAERERMESFINEIIKFLKL
jgi:ADP-ribosylglycohydrolase